VVRARRLGPAAKENFDKLVNIGKGAALMTRHDDGHGIRRLRVAAASEQAIAEAIQKNIMVGLPEVERRRREIRRDFQTSLGLKPWPEHAA